MEENKLEGLKRNPELSLILERVKKAAIDPMQAEGVSFIKNASAENEEAKVVNRVYDGLMLGLYSTAVDAQEQSELSEPGSRHAIAYKDVLRSMESLAVACRALADDEVPLQRAKDAEKYFERLGDHVSIYTADRFRLGNIPIDLMAVFIRPKKVELYPTIDTNLENEQQIVSNTGEVRDPVFVIKVLPKNSTIGLVSVEFDPEDLTSGKNVVYRISVDEEIELDSLEFDNVPESDDGHYYFAKLPAIELSNKGIVFSSVFRAINEKIEKSIVKDNLQLPLKRKKL